MFDGNSKPLEFLEQVEWSAETYGLDLDLVPRAMPELLKGTALKWYIANNEHWRTWTSFATSFQEFFLPRDYFTKLLEEVTRRKQGVDEPFKRYMVEMQTLMRPLRFSKERERQQIYSCSLPDFREFARPYQNGSLIELMQLAEEFEELERDRERLRQHTPQNRSRLMAIEDSRPRENNGPCTRCANHASTQPQPTPRAFSGPPTYTASGFQERADADRSSSTGVVGALRAEGHRLTATVQIGNKSYNATIDTGATSSFVSEELAVTLCEEGFELGATQRQVRIKQQEYKEIKNKEHGIINQHKSKQRRNKEHCNEQRYFPKNPKMQEEINKQVDELLAKGCIEPSNSPHSAPIVMVKKKTGKWRLCVDFRQLNSMSVKDAYPLPRVHHILDQLREAHYITSLDLKDGYWQIPMEKASRPLTAFTVPGRGLFQWKVMPFGLHAAPATFQRALDRVIGPEMLPHAFAYLDDIIVIGKTLEEHMANLKEVFRRLRAANLKINVDKCDFFKQELKYLGHKVTEHGICTDPEKVDAISKLKPPTNAKELRQYLGVASCATAAALQKAILARFGVPKVLITDNGAQFTSRTFKNFLQDTGVKHQYTAPYTPQENPTERANRTVKTMIAQFAGANQRFWDEALPEITLAVNTSVTASTGYSPAFVTQGREPRLPQALFDEVTIGTGQVAQEPRENARKLEEIFEIVRRSLEKAAQDQARHYNLRRRSWKPSVGDQVWLKSITCQT
ncbi:hypothetical protein ACLKA6_017759 [Drosophila palustris]